MREKAIKDVEIIDISYPNISIGKIDEEKTVQFKGGVLGQKVRVKITKTGLKIKKENLWKFWKNQKLKIPKNFVPMQEFVVDVLTKKWDMKQNLY